MVDEQQQPPLDQSNFTVSQTMLQAPPPPPIEPQDTKKRQRIILIGVGIFLFLTVIIMATLPRKQVINVTASPTPEPTTAVTVRPMQQVINQVTDTVKQAEPEGVLLPPPQVDMEVEF